MNLISKGCPINKLYWSMSTNVYRSMPTKYYWRVDQQNFVGVCPLNYIEGLNLKWNQHLHVTTFTEAE